MAFNLFLSQVRSTVKKRWTKRLTFASSEVKTPAQKIAYLLSRIFGPLPIICLLWLITAVKSGLGFWKAIWVYPLIFIVTVAIPIGFTTYLVFTKKVKDIEWSDIEDRRKYLPPIIISSLFSLIMLNRLLTNDTLFHLSLLLSVIILAIVFFYQFFAVKISAHIALATIAISTIILFFGPQFLWLYLLLIPLMWARHTLKVHTWLELFAGFAIPISIILLALLTFGWPELN